MSTAANPVDPRLADIEITDEHGYPTEPALDLISDWRGTPRSLVADLLEPIFHGYGSVMWGHRDSWKVGAPGTGGQPDTPTVNDLRVEMRLVTGGWSGNEDAIAALRRGMFWMWWQSSTRGGAHEFEIPANFWDQPMIEWPQRRDPLETLLAALDEHRQPVPSDADETTRRFLPPERLLDRLRERYTGEPVPPCRVCGGTLTVQSMGGGRATEYGCPKPDDVAYGEWAEHYSRSKWTQYRPGDVDVIALVDAVEALVGPQAAEERREAGRD